MLSELALPTAVPAVPVGWCWYCDFWCFLFAFAFSFLFFLHAVAVAVFCCSGPLLFGACCCRCPLRAKTFHFPNAAWHAARARMPSKVRTKPVPMVQHIYYSKSFFDMFLFPCHKGAFSCLVLFSVFQFLSHVAKKVFFLLRACCHANSIQFETSNKIRVYRENA